MEEENKDIIEETNNDETNEVISDNVDKSEDPSYFSGEFHERDKLSENNASTITKYAIKDPPLNIADFGDVIDYRYVFCRNDNYSFIKK